MDHGAGTLHLLFDAANHPVGDRVEKVSAGNAWQSLDPRFLITPSHAEFLPFLAVRYAEPPTRETVPA